MRKLSFALFWLGVFYLFSGVVADAAPGDKELVAENPYSQVKILKISGDEEAAYIDRKTTEIFNAATKSRRAAASYETPRGWTQEKLVYGGVPVEKYTFAGKHNGRVTLFLHGGGYVGGLNNRYRDWGIHLAEVAGSSTLLAVDYRIAPEHVYPAALSDAVAAYQGLLAAGYSSEEIVLFGDSAGGNLAAVLLLYLRDHDIPLPKAAVLISPWGDLSDNLPSRQLNRQKDKMLGDKNVRLGKEVHYPTYAAATDVKAPYVSPIYAELAGLPDLLIIAGEDELFLDDAVLLGSHAKAAGVKVQTSIYPDMSHDWTILLPELPESQAMNKEIRKFVNRSMK